MSFKYIISLGIICFIFFPVIGVADTECLSSDLAITMTDSPDPVYAGDTLTFGITTKNNGPITVNKVVVTVVLAIGISYQTGPNYCTASGQTVTCLIGTMTVGTQGFDLIVNVDPASSEYIASSATIQSPYQDPVPANNSINISTFVQGPVLAISVDDVEVNEPQSGTADAVFTVTLSEPSSFEVAVEYTTSDDTALAGTDYMTTTGILTFPPLTTQLPINIPILPDAETVEGSEIFTVNLSNATFAVISDPQGLGRISDPCIFCDHFDDNILRTDWTYKKPCWTEAGHALTGAPCATRRTFAVASPAFAGAGPGTVEAYMQTEGGPGNRLWLFAWYKDNKNTVELIMKEETDTWVLKQRHHGKVVSKNRVRRPIDPNIKYLVKLYADGTKFSFYLNDEFVTDFPQVAPVFGTVAFRTKDTVGRFCKVYVNAMGEN
jgi:uncharacterized repeat protein (TIGR01451 family)